MFISPFKLLTASSPAHIFHPNFISPYKQNKTKQNAMSNLLFLGTFVWDHPLGHRKPASDQSLIPKKSDSSSFITHQMPKNSQLGWNIGIQFPIHSRELL